MKTYAERVTAIIAELDAALRLINSAELDALRAAIRRARRVFITGKGRSGLQMRAFAMRLMHMGFTVYVLDEVTTPAITAGDLLIVGSGSGGTASLVQYVTRAKTLGAAIALLTTAPHSPIGTQAELVVQIPAASPKISSAGGSIQPMANLFEQALLITLDIIVMQLMDELNLTSEQMFTRHANLE
ncbi:MAG: 6-phospho-3-hexuloisomerase [Anaerolineae bacterium]